MASAFVGTISEIKELYKSNRLFDILNSNYQTNFCKSPEAQIRSWKGSIPVLIKLLDDKGFNSINIIIEYRMPIGDERADIILLGGNGERKSGIVIELKQWSSIDATHSPLLFSVPGIGQQGHPSSQALNYRGKLKLFHGQGTDILWQSVSLLHNMPMSYKQLLEHDDIDKNLLENSKIFYKENLNQFSLYISNYLLPCDIKKEFGKKFEEAEFEETAHLFTIVKKHAKEIANNATYAIAETGTGLTLEQQNIIETVIRSVEKQTNCVYIIEGGPGSGKTLLALHLLLRILANQNKTALVMRNNRLVTILRMCLDKSYSGASGLIKYSSIPRTNRGLGDSGFIGQFNCVVSDEAQRFNKSNIKNLMNRAPTTVFFYDESQLLNPPEEGTTVNFNNIAKDLNKDLIDLKLTNAIRCRGGEYYLNWVEYILSGVKSEFADVSNWSSLYEFRVVNTINDLLRTLKNRRDEHRVAMVASFTESKGDRNNQFSLDNIRIGYPLASGFDQYKNANIKIPWLMDPKKDYAPYWLEGISNKLDQIASIYGCQGFESDYVGVIWGRDLIRRNNKWVIGPIDSITDNIDGFKHEAQTNPDNAIRLLCNRYRIFLTRGILGTVVFCEDEETSDYLKSLLNNEGMMVEKKVQIYDKELNKDFELSIDNGHSLLHSGDFVEHYTYGIGKILSIGEKYYNIHFANGKFLSISKLDKKVQKLLFHKTTILNLVKYEDLSVGDTIIHNAFGIGQIIEKYKKNDDSNYVCVTFHDNQKRVLALKYAKLKKVIYD